MSEPSQLPAAKTERALKWAIFLGAVALIVYLCVLILNPFMGVIAWASVLAIAFYPVQQRLVQQTGRVTLSAFVTSLLVMVVILIPLLFVTGLAVDQFLALRDYLQRTFAQETDLSAFQPLQRGYEWLAARLGVDTTAIVQWVREHANELGQATAQYSLTIAANVTGAVVSGIFTIFAMFLLFREGDRIVARIPDLLPFERARSEAMLVRIRDVIYASVYGVVVIALIQGVLSGVMFWVLGIPSAALWGMVTVLTSVIPLVGAAGVWVPATIYLMLVGQWPQAIILAVWGGVVVSTVDNFLRPRLVGGRVGLSELVTFFALLGGLQVFGFIGIVLGPVLFAIVASILEVLSEAPPAPAPVEGDSE